MANEVKRNKKRRKRGVPTALVIVLLVIALAMGGLAGFAVARRTDPNRARLMEANARIIELENTLTLIGFSVDDDDPEDWLFGDDAYPGGALDLAGGAGGAESDLWIEDGLLSGTLDENADPVVVAEFEGGQLLSTEVIPEYNDQLTNQIFAGYSADDVADSVLQTVLSYMAGEKIIAAKARELGLDQITDADLAEINAQAQALYDDQVSYYTAFVAEPGMTPEAVAAAAEAYMRDESDVTLQSIADELKADWPTQKFYDYTVRDITVTDEEVEQYYRDSLAEQKASFAEYPEEYEFTHADGGTILYNPAGYRAVRNLLIPFGDDETAAKAADLLDEIDGLNPENDAERIQALEAELNPLYADLEAVAEEIVGKLQSGADFLALADEYGADEMMRSEPVRTQGYYISENSFLFSTEFIEGSMILDAPGQVSSPLRSASGLHLAQYVGDVPAGDVPLQDVYAQMQAEALEAKRDAYYEQLVAAMLDAANVRYYPERLQ